MKNKGFTLIELLAAMVILGILFIVAAPQIIGLLSKNQSKAYVNDVRKLMSQAEYKINASSTTIEKPDSGDCIVMSLFYLGQNIFEEAPNGGKYDKGASYVVVKNVNGTLEYSAAIVEKLPKGGYKGIELTKGELLHKNDATKYVKGINNLVTVEKNLDYPYINKKIGSGYVNKIHKIYNEPELVDKSSKTGSETPKIKKAVLSSRSGKEYNSLDALLTLEVEDGDTPTDKLTVYLSTTGYDDSSENAISYGNDNLFTKEYDFDKAPYNLTYDSKETVYLYIIVKDDSNNETRETINYEIHQNEAPKIDSSSRLVKKDADKVNKGTALVKLVVSDDIDDTNDLNICLTEDVSDDATCTDYKKYGTLFKDDVYHKFDDASCNLKGQTYKLNVFVKDSKDQVTSKVLSYTTHNDVNPTIDANSVNVISNEAYNSLNAKILVKGADDVTDTSDLRVRVIEGSKNNIYKYDENGIQYTFSGTYDGQSRTIQVSILDECNHESPKVTYNKYSIYKNTAPEVKDISINSNGAACKNSESCPIENGGNKDTHVSVEVKDDLDIDDLGNKIQMCVSETKSDCEPSKTENFKEFSEYMSGFDFEFSKGKSNPYDGSTKTLYVIVKDSGGLTNYNASGNSKTYKLYKNEAPTISEFEIVSEERPFVSEDNGSLNVTFFLTADDDILDMENLSYTIQTAGSDEIITKESLEDYDEVEGINYRVAGEYDGKARNIILKVYDNYDVSSTPMTKEYKIYQNQRPTISYVEMNNDTSESGEEEVTQNTHENDFLIEQKTYCAPSYKCPYFSEATEGGNAEVSVIFELTDDVDDKEGITEEGILHGEGKLSVCLSETESYCCKKKDASGNCEEPYKEHYVDYQSFLDGTEEVEGRSFTFNEGKLNPYDGKNHALYVYALDSGGLATGISKNYKLYKAEPPTIDESDENIINPNVESVEDPIEGNEEVIVRNSTKAKYTLLATDEFEDSINLELSYCYTSSSDKVCDAAHPANWSDYEPYNDSIDIEFKNATYNGEEFSVYGRVKNSLGLETYTTTPVIYKLWNDEKPVINSVDASFETSDLSESDKVEGEDYDNVEPTSDGRIVRTEEEAGANKKMKVSFEVSDPFDTYKICVSKDNNPDNCTFVGPDDSNGYDGTDSSNNLVYYVEPTHLYYVVNENVETNQKSYVSHDVYYAFVKDSHNKISEAYEFYARNYVICLTTERKIEKVEYGLKYKNEEKGTEITGERCGGKCYYYSKADELIDATDPEDEGDDEGSDEEQGEEDESNKIEENTITANYTKKIYYRDVFDNNKSCPELDTSGKAVVEDYTANCSFRDCFYSPKTSKYSVKAIGLTKRVFPRGAAETYTYTLPDTGEVVSGESHEYYMVYSTEYDPTSDTMILNPTREYVLLEEYNLDPDKYKYDKDADMPYVRVID